MTFWEYKRSSCFSYCRTKTLCNERVGTLRPQLQPPYLSGTVRFVESYTDYDNSDIYCDNLIPQIPALLSTPFEIALYLPFMTRIITKDILGTCTISDIMT